MTEKIRCYCLAILFLSWSFCLQLSYFYLCNEDVYITLLTETVRLPKNMLFCTFLSKNLTMRKLP